MKNKVLLIGLIPVLLGFVLFQKVTSFEWTNWDDDSYVLENPLVGKLSQERIKNNFTDFTIGAYHPLTTLSYCIDYSLGKYNPKVFHTTNLIFHLINIFLVFLVIFKLGIQKWIAVIGACIFAVHPMHVETVAWIADRKDLLMTFGMLFGLMFYLYYIDSSLKKHLIFSFLFFLLAVLSKGTAVVFPVLLLLIDWLKGRLSISRVKEKSFFILVSIVFLIVAKIGQQHDEAMEGLKEINYLNSFFYGNYNILFYISKFIYPVQLSGYHPYPAHKVLDVVPITFKMATLGVIVLTGVLVFFRENKKLIFSIGFFLSSIFLLLQFLPFGIALSAERFSYFPNIGLIIGVSFLIDSFQSKFKWAITIVIPILMGLSFVHLPSWTNSETLWKQVLKSYPDDERAYMQLGFHFMVNQDYPKAIQAFEKNNELAEEKYSSLNNIGLCYFRMGEKDKAFEFFSQSVKANPDSPEPRENRALLFISQEKYLEAFNDLKVIRKNDPLNPGLLYGEGLILLKNSRWKKAEVKLDSAFILHCPIPQLNHHRGRAKIELGKYAESKTLFSNSIKLNVIVAESYYFRSLAHFNLKNRKEAINDLKQAMKLGIEPNPAYRMELLKK